MDKITILILIGIAIVFGIFLWYLIKQINQDAAENGFYKE